MGTTGTTFIEQASAMVFNPANMEGIEHLSFGINMTNLVIKAWAPTQGPNTRGIARGYGPLPAGYLAGRIADRVVFGGSLTIETGFGGSFKDVVCLDGENFIDGEANTDPATCLNPEPQDLNVSFFQGEAALGVSIRAIDKLWFGITLRLPFSKQVADTYGNLLASQDAVQYGRSKTDLGGIGFPSPRIGITYKPNDKVSVGVMYRMWTKLTLTGTAEVSFLPGTTLDARTTWNIPHAIQFGVAYKPNPHLLFAFEMRIQFHGADKHGNPNQTTEVTREGLDLTTITPFGWHNVYAGRFGAEYRFPKTPLLALRGGFNFTNSSTVKEWATYFGPQPFRPVPSVSLGLGFFFDSKKKERKDMFKLDFAALFFYGNGNIGDEYIGQTLPVPGTDTTQTVCSFEQVQRTGCPGDYGNFTMYYTLGFQLQY